jgi:hypothetical protein
MDLRAGGSLKPLLPVPCAWLSGIADDAISVADNAGDRLLVDSISKLPVHRRMVPDSVVSNIAHVAPADGAAHEKNRPSEPGRPFFLDDCPARGSGDVERWRFHYRFRRARSSARRDRRRAL